MSEPQSTRTLWTPQEDTFLREHVGWTLSAIAAALGRTVPAVRYRRSEIGAIDLEERWTEDQIDLLRARYARTDESVNLAEFAQAIGRHKANVCRKARELGLTNRFRQKAGEMTEEHRQQRSDRLSQRNHDDPRLREGFSRTRGGKREDLGFYVRSAWEANYARYLNWLVEQRQIKSWRYEPVTFWFEAIKRGVRSYKPDFEVVNLDDSLEYHEVKGWDYARGQTARKRMAKYHPKVKLVLIGKEEYRAIAKWKRLIPEWE